MKALEILDLSRNGISTIPMEVAYMGPLRVLSLADNSITEVPLFFGHMDALQILKLLGNRLEKQEILNIVARTIEPVSPSLQPLSENRREAAVTKTLKEWMRRQTTAGDTGDESSNDEPLRTPRAPTRIVSMRFPIKTSTIDSDLAVEARSPGLPVRSHLRLASGQGEALQNPALRRPGLNPVTSVNGNERNRSNSESVLQGTKNNRSKRHGYVTKKTPDLARLDEIQANRNSFHLRGQSHGSVLRDKYSHDYRNSNKINGSLHTSDSERGTFVRRLSSLPEDKRESVLSDGNTEGAKGILYALHQVQPVFEALIPVIKGGDGGKSSPEGIYKNAVIQLKHLDQKLLELQSLENANNVDESARRRVRAAIFHACNASIIAYRHVGNLLLRNMRQLVVNGEPRYLRSLMLLLYGSLIESRNACKHLGRLPLKKSAHPPRQRGVPVIREDEQLRSLDYTTVTPIERARPERRWRNGAPILQGSVQGQSSISGTPIGAGSLYSNRSRSNSRTAVLHTPGYSSSSNTPHSGQSSTIPGTPLIRSRSNSAQAGSYAAEHPVYQTATRVHAQPEPAEHAALFEHVFLTLNSSVDQGLRTIPILRDQFTRHFQAAENQKPPSHNKILDLWHRLSINARTSLEICELLKRSMATFRLHEPDVHHAKNFWRLCRKFWDALTSLFTSMKDATARKLISSETVAMVHPVYKSSKEAIKMIHDSPWKGLLTTTDHPNSSGNNGLQTYSLFRSPSYTAYASGHPITQTNGYQSPVPPPTAINTAQPTPTINGTLANGYHPLAFHSRSRATSNASTSTAAASSSPYMTSIPATPLSAALGPAAMATVPVVSNASPSMVNGNGNVPSTPSLVPGALERSLQGDLYQRADTLLSMGGTMARGR